METIFDQLAVLMTIGMKLYNDGCIRIASQKKKPCWLTTELHARIFRGTFELQAYKFE
jgi:hypothetical protein